MQRKKSYEYNENMEAMRRIPHGVPREWFDSKVVSDRFYDVEQFQKMCVRIAKQGIYHYQQR